MSDADPRPAVVAAETQGGDRPPAVATCGARPRCRARAPGALHFVHHGGVLVVLLIAAGAGVAVVVEAIARARRGAVPGEATWLLAICGAVATGLAVAAVVVRLHRWRHGQWPDRSLAPARLLLYSLMGGWAGLILTNAPGTAIPIAAAAALTAFSAVMLARPLRRDGNAQRIARAIDIVLLNLCVVAITGEVGLRVLRATRSSVLLMTPDAGVQESLEASRYPPGTVRHGFPVNSRGHYDEEFLPKQTGNRLVICIGDSFSAGVVHHDFHFTTVAERRLEGTTIYNMGLPAIDLPQYELLLVGEALPLKPDAVVIDVFVGNDLSWPLPAPARGSRHDRWIDATNLLTVQVPRRLLILARQGRRARSALQDSASRDERAVTLHTREEVLEHYPWYQDPLVEPPTLARDSFLEIERRRAAQLCRQPTEGFALRLDLLNEMRDAARGVPVAVMIIPDVFQVDDSLWAEVAPQGTTEVQRTRSVAVTRRWLEDNGFAFLDLLPELRRVPPLSDGEPHLYKLNDTHFNARGNDAAGRALAAFLASWPALKGAQP